MTRRTTVPLRYGLAAVYITHAEIAAGTRSGPKAARQPRKRGDLTHATQEQTQTRGRRPSAEREGSKGPRQVTSQRMTTMVEKRATVADAARMPCGTCDRLAGGWRNIPGFEGLYQCRLDGLVRSLDRYVVQGSRHGHPVANRHHGRILTPYVTRSGRRQVILHADGRRFCRNVDDLVRQAFGVEVGR
jgi:hypothetical protein